MDRTVSKLIASVLNRIIAYLKEACMEGVAAKIATNPGFSRFAKSDLANSAKTEHFEHP